MKPFSLYILLTTLLGSSSDGWHLAQLGLNESYRVLHLSTHHLRVFLSITVRSKSFPTLIESGWSQSPQRMSSSVYPLAALHANVDHRDCTRVQQAHWTQVDSLSRLWVMDIGWYDDGGDVDSDHVCLPKLFVYDLSKNNAEVLRIDCSKYISPSGANILAIKLGPPASPCSLEKYVYFVLANTSYLLSYNILEQTWHRLKLMSHKYHSVAEALPIRPLDLAFGRGQQLLIADTEGVLYSSRNALLLNHTNALDGADSELQLDFMGILLGPSKSMLVDNRKGSVFYAVAKFGAVVRVEPKANLTTKDNLIIYMTSENVQQIFFGVHGSIWLLTDSWISPQDYCFRTGNR